MEGPTDVRYPDGILGAMAAVRDGAPVKVLRGYLDTAADPPRLYAGLDLSVFVKLKHIVAIQPEPDPLSPSLVWVREDLELDIEVPGRDLYGALLTENPELLFGLGTCDPMTAQAYACPRPKVTSHTIGWCAGD